MEDLAGLTDRLKLLADPNRVRLLHLLKQEELTVGELAAVLGQRQPTISGHLARLREAGLVQDRRDGTRSYCRLNLLTLDGGQRQVWELLETQLAGDPILARDRERMEEIVLARLDGTWVDRAAGSLDRRYVPGRSFETLAVGLAALVDLGDCVDLGSGDGSLLELIAPASRSLTCIDEHRGMLEAGEKRLAASPFENVRFVHGDMHEPPLPPESADTVLFLQSLQYAEEPARAIGAAADVLRPGGRCLVLTLGNHGDERIKTDYGHRHAGFETSTLRDWFDAAGLAAERCERCGHDVRSPQLPIVLALATKEKR